MRLPVVGDIFFKVVTLNVKTPQTSHVRVTKVGRTWATFETVGSEQYRHMGGRFDIQTGRLHHENFTSPGRVYDDEAAYQTAMRCKELWREFRRRLDHQYSVPDGVSEVEILKAADALKIKLESE